MMLILIFVSFRWRSEALSDAKTGLQVGKTETHSSSWSSSTSCASENSTFSARHILFFSDNPHPLCRKIVAHLEQRLKTSPFIGRLELTDKPFISTNAGAAPDLFLSVNLTELKNNGIVSSTMKTDVTASLGNAPRQSSSHTVDDSTAPLVSFAWNSAMDSETTFTGVRTDRYAEAARSIGDDLAKSIIKQIEELAGKYPKTPDLPADFYGPYQPVADFDCVKEQQARRIASYCGLFTQNETFWRFQTSTNPVPQLQNLIRQLESGGWKFRDVQLTNTQDQRAVGQQSDATLEIFRQRNERASFSIANNGPDHFEFIVHYRKPFTRAEREAALEKLFTQNASAETLLPFLNSFSSDQRQRFFTLVERSPITSPQACLQLAEQYLNQKRTNDAIHLLLRAKALTGTIKDAAAQESRITDLAKKISPKKDLKLVVTPEICRELGFIELTNLTQVIEQTRNFGQPLVFFGSGPRGVRIMALTVSAPRKNSYPWLRVEAEDGMKSTSSSSFTPDSKHGWRYSTTMDGKQMTITAVPLPAQSKVKMTVAAGD